MFVLIPLGIIAGIVGCYAYAKYIEAVEARWAAERNDTDIPTDIRPGREERAERSEGGQS